MVRTDSVAQAIESLPGNVRHRLEYTDFLIGCDPVFVGLHQYGESDDGRLYKDTAHCVYPYHMANLPKHLQKTTIVLPCASTICTVIHELGHVLHEQLGFISHIKPVSTYAETNHLEAFAEAFTAWFFPDRYKRIDEQTHTLFEYLKSGG